MCKGAVCKMVIGTFKIMVVLQTNRKFEMRFIGKLQIRFQIINNITTFSAFSTVLFARTEQCHLDEVGPENRH